MDNFVREDESYYAINCFAAVCLDTLGKYLRFEQAFAVQSLTGQRGTGNTRTQPCCKCWATCAKPRICALIHPAPSQELHIPNRPEKIKHNLSFMMSKFMCMSTVTVPGCSLVSLSMG